MASARERRGRRDELVEVSEPFFCCAKCAVVARYRLFIEQVSPPLHRGTGPQIFCCAFCTVVARYLLVDQPASSAEEAYCEWLTEATGP